ncbi:hypothetical protein [Vibrio barjaei]|uniref:hypothetical protein n=1 Tax=Vibrio barjaei TaxID=1676683 RepID=UPI0022845BB8|nr:hypothetical protein [Vibrio barjaei]MCY9874524.1 hypothetical protein [Vibrio barjaei]
MHGFVIPTAEKEPKWEETRQRVNGECVKVNRVNVNATTFVDPKGDYEIMESMSYYCAGQLPYGEWLKKLSKADTPPRGLCARYFKDNVRFRRN